MTSTPSQSRLFSDGAAPVRGGPTTGGAASAVGVPPGRCAPSGRRRAVRRVVVVVAAGGDRRHGTLRRQWSWCCPPDGRRGAAVNGGGRAALRSGRGVAGRVVVVGACAQVGSVNVSLSNVTAPLRARARPWTVTLVVTRDRGQGEDVPREDRPGAEGGGAADLPEDVALLRAVDQRDACCPSPVMSVESVWKMKTESRLPAPSRTRGPVRPSGRLARVRRTRPAPGCSVPRSAVVVASTGRPAAFT